MQETFPADPLPPLLGSLLPLFTEYLTLVRKVLATHTIMYFLFFPGTLKISGSPTLRKSISFAPHYSVRYYYQQ
jgi:hypothetical protein